MNDPLRSPNTKGLLDGHALYLYGQMVRKTCTFQVAHLERLRAALVSDRPVIITAWHGMTMMIVPFIQNHCSDMSNFTVIVPGDWRGEALRIWADRLGSAAFSIDLTGENSIGLARQVLKLTRRMVGGKHMFINPDGPNGPAHILKPGLSFIAKRSKALVLPIGAYCRHGYDLPRWDRYTMPYPYSRVAYHVAKPITVFPDDDAEATALFTSALNRVTLQAAADYYERRGLR